MARVKIYEAKAGDRYLSHVDDGVEFLVRKGVRGVNPHRPWQQNPPPGVIVVHVRSVTAEGVEEVTEVLGVIGPKDIGPGWEFVRRALTTCGQPPLSQVFKRLRTHPVHVMPEDAAERLLARLRAEQIERRHVQAEREARLRVRQVEEQREMKQRQME